jgi:hypothetical protein
MTLLYLAQAIVLMIWDHVTPSLLPASGWGIAAIVSSVARRYFDG